MERGTPELKVLYMCSSSGVKKALNQPSVKTEKKEKDDLSKLQGMQKSWRKSEISRSSIQDLSSVQVPPAL